jgi:hypothetical protein
MRNFFRVVRGALFKWLNRRGGKRKSFTGPRFAQILERVKIAWPRITEGPRRRYA